MARSQEGPASLGKVVVVGGCGFLGSHIVNYIVERHPQTQVAVLDLRTNSNRNASSTVSYHDGDITDLAAMMALFSTLRPDAVIHTASPHFNMKPEIHDKVNVGGTKNLVKAAQETGVKAFVYTSSASVILGATEPLVNADERWPIVAGAAQPEYYTTTKVSNHMHCCFKIASLTAPGLRRNRCSRSKPQARKFPDVRDPTSRHHGRRRRPSPPKDCDGLP
jgi:sterol-4alpha-carboxylate 3-dehydrogenase (decarboxylating)